MFECFPYKEVREAAKKVLLLLARPLSFHLNYVGQKSFCFEVFGRLTFSKNNFFRMV